MIRTSMFRPVLAAAVALTCVSEAQAALITSGFTFSVASASNSVDAGSHFHSNTGGAFGNPAGKAEVGRFATEEVRGLSEYNLTGLASVTSAYFTFDVFRNGGLFAGVNDTPFIGNILVDAYLGNNLENVSDYQAISIGSVGSFAVNPASLLVGDVISFDITSILNSAISAGSTSLGIRLREDRSNAAYTASQAWTFQDFRLTSDSQCTNAAACNGGTTPVSVPEPGTLALVAMALGHLAQRRRTKLKQR